jgi:hypothetical protein
MNFALQRFLKVVCSTSRVIKTPRCDPFESRTSTSIARFSCPPRPGVVATIAMPLS